MSLANTIQLIVLLPLGSFLLLGIFGRKYLSSLSGMIGTTSLLVSAILSIQTAYQYFFLNTAGSFEKIIAWKMTWLTFSEGVSIDMGILVDPISVMMLVMQYNIPLDWHDALPSKFLLY